jgi:hypothetical protein
MRRSSFAFQLLAAGPPPHCSATASGNDGGYVVVGNALHAARTIPLAAYEASARLRPPRVLGWHVFSLRAGTGFCVSPLTAARIRRRVRKRPGPVRRRYRSVVHGGAPLQHLRGTRALAEGVHDEVCDWLRVRLLSRLAHLPPHGGWAHECGRRAPGHGAGRFFKAAPGEERAALHR